jgi:hypothetical protein
VHCHDTIRRRCVVCSVAAVPSCLFLMYRKLVQCAASRAVDDAYFYLRVTLRGDQLNWHSRVAIRRCCKTLLIPLAARLVKVKTLSWF